MLDVDDEFFVLVRPVPGGVALLLSDAAAALDYDVAADVLDLLRLEVPDEDEADDDPWPEGDLTMLADLGVPSDELAVLVEEIDLYPDEQLTAIARRQASPTSWRRSSKVQRPLHLDLWVGRALEIARTAGDDVPVGAIVLDAGAASSPPRPTPGRPPPTRPRTPRSSPCVRPPGITVMAGGSPAAPSSSPSSPARCARARPSWRAWNGSSSGPGSRAPEPSGRCGTSSVTAA